MASTEMVSVPAVKKPMDAEQWKRVDQVHELVKQEGDARCEAAFDDLIAEVNALRGALIEALPVLAAAARRQHGRAPWVAEDFCERELCGRVKAWHRLAFAETEPSSATPPNDPDRAPARSPSP